MSFIPTQLPHPWPALINIESIYSASLRLCIQSDNVILLSELICSQMVQLLVQQGVLHESMHVLNKYTYNSNQQETYNNLSIRIEGGRVRGSR